jgi:hypothetical protein
VALLRSLVMYLQYLSLSLELRLRWPPALLRVFAWLRALTNGIQLAAPECVSPAWSYQLYVQLLLLGLGALFVAALAMHELARLRQRFILLGSPDEQPAKPGGCLAPASDNAAKLARLYSLWERRNALKSFACFALSFAYLYVVGVLLEAWDCIPTPDGPKLRSDPTTMCTSAKHLRFRLYAMVLIVVVGPGVPVGYLLWLRHLRGHALSNAALLRPAWRGLSDPSTRAGWGGLYEMVRTLAWCAAQQQTDASLRCSTALRRTLTCARRAWRACGGPRGCACCSLRPSRLTSSASSSCKRPASCWPCTC